MASLHKHLTQLFREAKNYGDKASKNFKEEDIHNMRVAVKKIKAAFHFLQFFNDDLKDTELKKLKKIFGEAGELRELQLLTEAIQKFRSSPHKEQKQLLLHYLDQEKKKAKKKFHHQFQKEAKEVLNAIKKVMLHEKRIDDKDLSRYCILIVQSIVEQMRCNNLTTEQYHELRKKLKELKYNLSFADQQSKKMVVAVFSEPELEALEEQLGNWHDRVIIIQRLKEIAADKIELVFFITAITNQTQQHSNFMLKRISKQFMKKISSIK